MKTEQVPVTVAREAMATRFEIALHGEDPVGLRAAAEEALDEVERVESMLSWRKPTSPVALINARASHEPVRINPEFFALLEQCKELWEGSNGAFDITVGPLMRAYGFPADGRNGFCEDQLAEARASCGLQYVQLNKKDSTIEFQRPGMQLDFGAIGKGYALDLALEILRETGVENALLHGGTSSVCALGHPPDSDYWKIAVEYPPGESAGETLPVLSVIKLRDNALSVSAVWGRVFQVGQDTFGHVLDPRTGEPTQRALLSIWTSESATEADALSTALLTEGDAGMAQLVKTYPKAASLVLATGEDNGPFKIGTHGIEWLPMSGDAGEN